ncbi:MAG: sporulation protein YabP [Bacilli bacterium]|nr:sporulation protein YabP [Bacilli bacterium]MBQ6283020.1 sporulation protein YabP [Bacilli bacterium]
MNSNSSHSLTIIDRSTINISGVNKIESFDKEEFLLETVMGYMNIKGEALEMIKLDTIEGKVVIKGKINSLVYLENIKKKNNDENFFAKLFK